jgi:hypothetical protein
MQKMNKKINLTLLLLVAVITLAAANAPRVGRATLVSVEKNLDGRIRTLWDDNPYLLLGSTRGVYLEGYGAVFTAEVDLVVNPTSLMNANIKKDEIVKFHQKKLERIPLLKKALCEAMVSVATSLDSVPPDEQITIVAFLPNHSWEDMTGIPTQLTLQATRRKLLDAQRAGGAGHLQAPFNTQVWGALDSAIRVTEN